MYPVDFGPETRVWMGCHHACAEASGGKVRALDPGSLAHCAYSYVPSTRRYSHRRWSTRAMNVESC